MIDLRSDTVTQPTDEMREVIASAIVGDDVYGDDPTVNDFEQRMAGLSGMEAALLVPTGTQSNLTALLSHCQRGEEYIVGQDYHSYLYEAGGAAVLGSIQPQPISVETDGSLDLNQVMAVLKPDDSHFARSKLLSLENTHCGKVIPISYFQRVRAFCHQHDLSLHLDGARIFNATTALGIKLQDICQHVDSISICFSKGLGTPAGSVLCGSKDFIQQARRWRKMLGGGMRQAGMLAAAMDYALDHHVVRLQHDHNNARHLADLLAGLPGCTVDEPQSNMVYLHLPDAEQGNVLQQTLLANDIKISGGKTIRLVTHLDISTDDIDRVAGLISSSLR